MESQDEETLLRMYENDFGNKDSVKSTSETETEGPDSLNTVSSTSGTEDVTSPPQKIAHTTARPSITHNPTVITPKRASTGSQYKLSVRHKPQGLKSIKLKSSYTKPFTTQSGDTLPSRVLVVSRKMLENRV